MMSRAARATCLAGLAVTTALAATAAADETVAGAPTAPPATKRGHAGIVEPELPDAEVRLQLVAPSAQAPWTLRIENEGPRPVRVPADVRLLRFTVESGDTMTRSVAKPVRCAAPPGLRPDGFPDRNALLLGPGDAYVETFDPRLFCFGKDAKVLAGGALVRAAYGWDAPKGAKKLEPPYAVEGTELPAAVAPKKHLVAPTFVLSYLPPDVDEPPPAPDAKPAGEAPVEADEAAGKDDKPVKGPPEIVDERAPRLELSATPWVDAAAGSKVAITVTAANAGQRATLAAIRARMIGFRVEGPSGTFRCVPAQASHAIPREGYQTYKPGGTVSMTVLVEEACGRELFRRPGLYRVTPSLHLNESGAEIGLAALTGVARAKEPTLVRVATGPEPFHAAPPKAVRAVRVDEVATP